ncbi:MAG: hypothetical protein ABSB88_24635 [Bryobacteraceae bacterium]|jgi:hypothetical protein
MNPRVIRYAQLAAVFALAAIAAGCHSAPPAAVDRALASSVPADTVILGGVDCERLRASPVYRKLPAAVRAILEPLRPATYLLLAFNGRDYLAIGRGPFGQAPPGATLLARDLAVAGPADAVRAATAQHRRGVAGTPLVGLAERLAAGREIWIVAMGNATLPVSGNAQNLNRLLHSTEYATLGVHVTDGIEAEATGVCGTAEGARRLEEELRAMASIAAAAEARQPGIAAELRAIQVSREERTVRVDLRAGAAGVEQLLRLF